MLDLIFDPGFSPSQRRLAIAINDYLNAYAREPESPGTHRAPVEAVGLYEDLRYKIATAKRDGNKKDVRAIRKYFADATAAENTRAFRQKLGHALRLDMSDEEINDYEHLNRRQLKDDFFISFNIYIREYGHIEAFRDRKRFGYATAILNVVQIWEKASRSTQEKFKSRLQVDYVSPLIEKARKLTLSEREEIAQNVLGALTTMPDVSYVRTRAAVLSAQRLIEKRLAGQILDPSPARAKTRQIIKPRLTVDSYFPS